MALVANDGSVVIMGCHVVILDGDVVKIASHVEIVKLWIYIYIHIVFHQKSCRRHPTVQIKFLHLNNGMLKNYKVYTLF
ncbi:hypothetical protein E2636_13590 [Paenisporosarcina antarctica]|uniref:Uncharacterized protein n=1 Tax=Paenisporosarcina antarctica TaxID=417367 RepID=A0A4P7A2F5_9BACL|nr:hypothetical protein E2636_13590 [Paenisporosarcina antarctica]